MLAAVCAPGVGEWGVKDGLPTFQCANTLNIGFVCPNSLFVIHPLSSSLRHGHSNPGVTNARRIALGLANFAVTSTRTAARVKPNRRMEGSLGRTDGRWGPKPQ
jgi:hypothetical protein